jgi:hypothetical protein
MIALDPGAAGSGLQRVERKYKPNISEQRYRTAHANFSLAETLVDSRDAAMPADMATRRSQIVSDGRKFRKSVAL